MPDPPRRQKSDNTLHERLGDKKGDKRVKEKFLPEKKGADAASAIRGVRMKKGKGRMWGGHERRLHPRTKRFQTLVGGGVGGVLCGFFFGGGGGGLKANEKKRKRALDTATPSKHRQRKMFTEKKGSAGLRKGQKKKKV